MDGAAVIPSPLNGYDVSGKGRPRRGVAKAAYADRANANALTVSPPDIITLSAQIK